MKLKHMTTQFNRLPDRAATLYYSFGVDSQTGKMYESHTLVEDRELLLLSDEQLNDHVTKKLETGIREVAQQELDARAAEMRGAVLH